MNLDRRFTDTEIETLEQAFEQNKLIFSFIDQIKNEIEQMRKNEFEQITRIRELEETNEKLEKENEELKDRIVDLEDEIISLE